MSSSSMLLGGGGLDIVARRSRSAIASGERPELESPLGVGGRVSDMKSVEIEKKKVMKVSLESQQCGTKERGEKEPRRVLVFGHGAVLQL